MGIISGLIRDTITGIIIGTTIDITTSAITCISITTSTGIIISTIISIKTGIITGMTIVIIGIIKRYNNNYNTGIITGTVLVQQLA